MPYKKKFYKKKSYKKSIIKNSVIKKITDPKKDQRTSQENNSDTL